MILDLHYIIVVMKKRGGGETHSNIVILKNLLNSTKMQMHGGVQSL